MQIALADFIKHTPEGNDAADIVRKCVHCGFCAATCPTYQLLNDELDGPRGRIYLIKQTLEGNPVSAKTQLHLDRCLTCRACETTCPSGVEYGRLLEIGRDIVEQQVARSRTDVFKRKMIRFTVPVKRRFSTAIALARLVKPLLPAVLKNKLPVSQQVSHQTEVSADSQHQRRVLVLEGCAQSTLAPNTNNALARILNCLEISVDTAPQAGCCGAISLHLSAREEALNFMRRNIDAWWPHMEAGAEAIIMTASGCGVTVKDYGILLRHDPNYAAKAAHVSQLTRDASEYLIEQRGIDETFRHSRYNRVAFHSPCTLQHGQKIEGVVEKILQRVGYQLVNVRDSHLCCGSAGTYSLLQAEISERLRNKKVELLQEHNPDIIATANIGCQTHLSIGSKTPVMHWLELLSEETLAITDR